MYTTEKSLTEFGNYLTDEELEELTRDLQNARGALDSDDVPRIRQAMTELENSSYRMAEIMYQGNS